MTSIVVERASTNQQWEAALALIDEYAASLGIDLSFQDFEGGR